MEKNGFEFDTNPFILVASVEKYSLTADMLSSNAIEPSEGSLANLLDGDIGTYFHSAWSVSIADKHYVQVKLPVSTKTFRFTYTNRSNNGNAALAWFNLYTGTNENNLQLTSVLRGMKMVSRQVLQEFMFLPTFQ